MVRDAFPKAVYECLLLTSFNKEATRCLYSPHGAENWDSRKRQSVKSSVLGQLWWINSPPISGQIGRWKGFWENTRFVQARESPKQKTEAIFIDQENSPQKSLLAQNIWFHRRYFSWISVRLPAPCESTQPSPDLKLAQNFRQKTGHKSLSPDFPVWEIKWLLPVCLCIT